MIISLSITMLPKSGFCQMSLIRVIKSEQKYLFIPIPHTTFVETMTGPHWGWQT